MADDDGLGGGAVETPTEDEEVETGHFPVANDEDEGEDSLPAWLQGADEDLVAYATGKGLKDPASALRSMRESEKSMREAMNQLAQERQAREEQEQYAARLESGGSQSQQGDGEMTFEDQMVVIDQAFAEGQIDETTSARLRAEAINRHVDSMLEQRIGEATRPLVTANQKAELERAAFDMTQRYPNFADMSDDVVQILNTEPAFKDPAFRDSAAGVEAAFGIAASRRAAQEATERARAPETLNSGSRTRQGPTAEETIKRMIATGGRRPNDGI